MVNKVVKFQIACNFHTDQYSVIQSIVISYLYLTETGSNTILELIAKSNGRYMYRLTQKLILAN